METLTKDICEIIIIEADAINDKIQGLNFLEILKINLVEKLLPVINDQKLTENQKIDFKKQIEKKSRIINISITHYVNSLSITKKIIQNDSLFISFNEASIFDIYKDEKRFTSILLYKNTGISLPKDVVINSKLNKNVLLLEIQYKDSNQVLTK